MQPDEGQRTLQKTERARGAGHPALRTRLCNPGEKLTWKRPAFSGWGDRAVQPPIGRPAAEGPPEPLRPRWFPAQSLL